MSKMTKNERLAQEFFEKLSTGDLEQVRPLFHKNASWIVRSKGIPGAGVHQGRDHIIDDFLGPVRNLFEPGDPKIYVDRIFGKGALVAVQSKSLGRMRNGKNYENYYAWILMFRGGKIFELSEYMDTYYVSTLVGG
jgi:ketosteroid isomerase-like protein